MGIFDRARDGQQYAEKVEALAGQSDTGTPPEDLGGTEPAGLDNPMSPGQSPADAIRPPIAEANP